VLQCALLCVLTLAALGWSQQGAEETRFQRLGHEMMCVCGCSEILLECNHVGCPDSDRMIGELRDRLAAGDGDTAIQNWFVAKYGPTVLAAPIRGGFDDVAWIAPIGVFVAATLGTAVVVVVWKRRSGPRLAAASATPGPAEIALRERIRRETEY
jgi:cytochrome c-type biogenesis protein CcmH/NrfF